MPVQQPPEIDDEDADDEGPEFCNNCEFEATNYYVTDAGARFYLCSSCCDAFELGQVNPDKKTPSIDDVEEEEEGAEPPDYEP